jgi:ABC-type Fe3+-siderophore transport system permease subunit
MHHQTLIAGTLLAATADTSKHFHIGPWIIVPILILIAIIGTPIFVIKDRRKRRSSPQTR